MQTIKSTKYFIIFYLFPQITTAQEGKAQAA